MLLKNVNEITYMGTTIDKQHTSTFNHINRDSCASFYSQQVAITKKTQSKMHNNYINI